MEESKDLIVGYKIFRSLVYVSLLLEFFLYAVDPGILDFWGGILADIHGRMRRWFIYAEGNLIWSKVATLLLICITSIGTRNKKKLEFDARKMVLYPLVGGLFTVVLSVWLFGHRMSPNIY
ncbi:MAG: type IV secretory system conjugative DNA transfer family protein, partial [Lachnospiraceae bacterium]|nr:type IV secretory system conjugative DNA transfer family protein [Lachnospiraceae bacterium]